MCECFTFTLLIPTPTYSPTEELFVSLLPIEMIIGEKKIMFKKIFQPLPVSPRGLFHGVKSQPIKLVFY